MEGEQNLQDLFNWVDSHAISRQKKNLNRDFSDAVPLAEILKQHFPRWVDLHNYGAKNSVAKKIDNWFTMNRKVLSKLDTQLTQDEMIKLAKATPGAIEDLLFKVKRKVEEYEKEEEGKTDNCEDNLADGEKAANESSMVPLELLEKQAIELDIKNEAIKLLNQKVNQLQDIIDTKDKTIAELQRKINDYIKKEKSYYFHETMVPIDEVERIAYELCMKNEEIEILNQKISHLNLIVNMKSQLIDELQQKLDKYIETENSSYLDKYMK